MILLGLSAFLVGVVAATFFSYSALAMWIVIAAVSVVVSVLRDRRVLGFALVLILGLSIGMVRFWFADRASELSYAIGNEVSLAGYVDGEFQASLSGGSFFFHVSQVNGVQYHERILVRSDVWPAYELGEDLEIQGVVRKPWSGSDFDYVSYLKKDGVQVIFERPAIVSMGRMSSWSLGTAWTHLKRRLMKVRDFMANGVRAEVPEPSAAYVNGILLGMREDLPADVTEAFSRTGTTHVLAISGYNVAIVAQGLMLLCLTVMSRRLSIWVAILGIALFSLLTGASASVIRAAIMGSMVLLAQSSGETLRPAVLILLTGVLMSLYNPFVVRYDIGFQLSFAAVIGLVYISPVLEGLIDAPQKMKSLWQMTAATGAANMATLPLILAHFGTLPVYSLPANMLILPLVPYAMAWGVVAGIGSWVLGPLSVLAGIPAWALASWQLAIVRMFSMLPGASIDIGVTWLSAGIMYAVLVVSLMLYGNRRSNNITDE